MKRLFIYALQTVCLTIIATAIVLGAMLVFGEG